MSPYMARRVVNAEVSRGRVWGIPRCAGYTPYDGV